MRYVSYSLRNNLLDNFFNWTMTYRHDSDFPNFYGHFIQLEVHPSGHKLENLIRNFGKKNQHLIGDRLGQPGAFWLVSNCRSRNRRAEMAKEIQSFYPLDIYGACGELKCDKSKSAECYADLSKKYLFYLSFENANCKDYVTEKFFNVFKYDLIPIVHGGADYANYFPPHSYINVRDFRTGKDLAKYLRKLSNDSAEYASFFWWRDFYKLSHTYLDNNHRPYCDLCEKLNDQNAPPKIYKDIKKWWMDGSSCDNYLFDNMSRRMKKYKSSWFNG